MPEKKEYIREFPIESFRALYETLGESQEYKERHFRISFADEPGRFVCGYEVGIYRTTTVYSVGIGDPGESEDRIAWVAPGWDFEEIFGHEEMVERNRIYGPCQEQEVQ